MLLLLQVLAVPALLGSQMPLWSCLLAILACVLYSVWVISGPILLQRASAFRGLRCTPAGWEIWSPAAGWQAIQLKRDSLALPMLVVLRFRLAGEWRVRGLCIAADALPAPLHRQLRLRLKFSRRRWAEPE